MPSLCATTDILQSVFIKKVERNPRYSLRAFARDLGVSHAYLSQLFHGRRSLSVARAKQFAVSAKLDDASAETLISAAKVTAWETKPRETPTVSVLAEYHQLELDRFKVLSQWHHLAILDLTLIENFQPNYAWVARKLGLKTKEVHEAADRLCSLGLLTISKSEGWKKTHRMLEVPTKKANEAVRRYHESMMKRALVSAKSKQQRDFESRDITGMLMTIDPTRLPEAKKRIRKFRRKLMEYLSAGKCTELYQLNVQLFRLSRRLSGE